MTAIDDPAPPVARNPRREAQEVVGDATSFRGAILPFGRLVDAAHQRTAALDFLRRGRALLEP